VAITTPKLLEPLPNQAIPGPEQPVTLLIENASSNGERPVTYLFEISTDLDFNNKVFTRDGVAPGTGGRTSLKLPDALASDRTYYWRARASDGANSSNYTGAAAFQVVTPAVIGTPTPVAPVGGTRIASRSPEFIVNNAARTGPVGAVSYVFEISTNATFTAIVAVITIPEGSGQTRFMLAGDLNYDTTYYWRVRAFDPQVASAWSGTNYFKTPTEPVITVPTTPTTPTSPTVPPSGWPKTGAEVVAYVKSKYPDKLVAGVSLSQRQANMAFIRDRMIEAGICGGMDLGLNLKRGGPEISIDFLVHKSNGVDIGVDIGMDYDNTSVPLQIYWGSGAPGPFYKYYTPRPTCK
jgi:hypothetical protein